MHRLPPISELERTVGCKRTSNDENLLQSRKKFRAGPLSVERNMKKNLKTNFLKENNSINDAVPGLTEDFGIDKCPPDDQPLEENVLLMSYTLEDLNVEYELLRDEIITLNIQNNFDDCGSFDANARLKIEPIHDDNFCFKEEPIHDDNFCFKEEPIHDDNFSFNDNEGFENVKDYEGCNNEIISSPMFQQMNEQSVISTAQTIEGIEKCKEKPSINYFNEFSDFVNTKDYKVVLKEPISLNELVKEKNLNNLNFKVSKKVNSKSSKNKSEISKQGKFKKRKELSANCDTSNKKEKLKCYKKNYSSTSVQKNSKHSKNSKEKNLSNNSILKKRVTVLNLKIKTSKSLEIEPEINKQVKVKQQKWLISNFYTSNKNEKVTDYTKKNCRLTFSLQKNNKHFKNSKDKHVCNNSNLEKTNFEFSKNKSEISKQRKVKNLRKMSIINGTSSEKENLTRYKKKIKSLISSVKKNSKRTKNSNSFELPKNISIPQVQANSFANLRAEKNNTVKETLNLKRYSKGNKQLKSIERYISASSDHSINNLSNQDSSQNCLTSKNTQHNKTNYESRTKLLSDSNYLIENDNISSFHIKINSSANAIEKNNKLQRTETDSNKQLNKDERLINTQAYKNPGEVANVTNLLVQDIAAKNSISISSTKTEEMGIACKKRELSNLFVDSNKLKYSKLLTEGESNGSSCNSVAGVNNAVFCQNLKQSSLEKGKENYEITKSKSIDNSDSEVIHNLRDFVNLVNSTKCSSKKLLTSEIHNKVPKLKIRDDIYQNFESNSTVINSRRSSNNEILLEHHDPHFSTNYIKRCLDRWKIRYPWVKFHENEGTLSCEVCSVHSSVPYVVWEVKSSEDIFKIAASLLSHSTLKGHEILLCIRNPKVFQEIYAFLKNIIPHVTSRRLLYYSINMIVKHAGDITISDESIELIINTIASTFKKTLLKGLLAYSGCGIAYTCDPHSKILIARIPNAKYFPEEYIVTDFMDSSLSLNNYLLSKGFNNDNITFKKTFEYMDCNFSEKDDNTFPLRWPSSKELLSWMLGNDAIRAYSIYVKNLSVLYNKYTANFNLIKDAYILASGSWENFHVYRLLLKNTPQIKSILHDLYKMHSDINAKYCSTYTIDKGGIFYNIIDTISYITWYVDTQQFSNSEKEFRQKINHFLIILLERKYMKHMYDMPLKILTLYCKEILKDEYHIGKKNLLGCQFLFQPKRLACINTSQATFEELSSIQNLNTMFRHHLPSCEQFLENLSRFGHYLCQFISKPYIPIYEMCNIFGTSPDLRLNYPFVQIFYTILSTLPIFIAVPRISLFGVRASMHFFNYYFGEDLGKDLITIRYGALRDIYIQKLHHDVVHKILFLNDYKVSA